MIGTFFIKASAYEFMRYNNLHGGQSQFYSFEYQGENSVFDLLFMGGNTPPIPGGMCIIIETLKFLAIY